MTDWRESQIDSWNYTQFATYVEVENGDCDLLNQKIRNLAAKYNPDSKIQMSLQPMGDIHLSSADINSWMIVYPNPGNLSHLYLFSLIALSILLLACINYMNLSTANSYNRSKEIGIRKVSGAFRVDLISQFLGETIFLAFFSFLLALILVELFLPSFNSLSGKTLNYHFFENGQISWFIFIIVLGTGLIKGS